MRNIGVSVKGKAAEHRRGRKAIHGSNFKMVPQ